MKILSWNVRGLCNSKAVKSLKRLIFLYKHDITFLCETKLTKIEMDRVKRRCGYQHYQGEPSDDRSGGLALMWTDETKLKVNATDKYYIDAEVGDVSSNGFRLTGFYGDPEAHNRKHSWKTLSDLNKTNNGPWIVCGDFNEIISDDEKWGGVDRNVNQMKNFQDVLDECELIDLGFVGPRFRWTNNRNTSFMIRERLDRMNANADWCAMFTNAVVEHLIWSRSDHCPLFLNKEDQRLARAKKKRNSGRFRFEKKWAEDENCQQIVWSTWREAVNMRFMDKLSMVGSALKKWCAIHIKEVNKQIKDIQKEISLLQNGIPNDTKLCKERTLRIQLATLLEEEENYRASRSRSQWLKEGDRNTTYYHAQASARRKRNLIVKLLNSDGHWVDSVKGIHKEAVNYFKDLFATSGNQISDDIIEPIATTITSEMNENLLKPFEAEEIKQTLKQTSPVTTPKFGPRINRIR